MNVKSNKRIFILGLTSNWDLMRSPRRECSVFVLFINNWFIHGECALVKHHGLESQINFDCDALLINADYSKTVSTF